MNVDQGHPVSVNGSRAGELFATATFVAPDLASSHVRRRRLLDSLTSAESLPLVLVSGPAGTGKTSLVAEWVRTRLEDSGTTGWITFEDGDTDLWGRVLECLTRLGLDVSGQSSPTAAGAALGRQRLLALAGLIAQSAHRWRLVLDGYEMGSLELAREVDFLLRHTCGHLSLILVGRVDPVLPLYRYRLRDELSEIRMADLAFSEEEAAELFVGLGVSLGRESLRDLNQHLNGWVTGLRLTARALAGRTDPEDCVAEVVAHTGDINEYLIGEVLDSQCPEVRRFLLDTCVPDLLLPGLVEELAGPGNVRRLAEVAKSNAFIERVPPAGSYRYYPFFRDMLRAQLAYESPERVVDLHRRAARWFWREGLPDLSIRQLVTIAAWDDVADQLVDGLMIGRLILEGAEGPLHGLADQLPEDLGQPAACIVRAAVALVAGDTAACADELARARGTAHGEDRAGDAAAVAMAVLDALRASAADHADEAAALADAAERVIDVGRTGARNALSAAMMSALVLSSKGKAELRRGRLEHARSALASAAGLDAVRAHGAFRADCLGQLALADALGGHLSQAKGVAAESLSIAANTGVHSRDHSPAAHVALASVALDQYDLKTARAHVASAMASRLLATDPMCRGIAEGVLAGVERGDGHLRHALDRISAACAVAAPADRWLGDYLHVQAAQLGVASGRPEFALRELGEVHEPDAPAVQVVAAAAHVEQARKGAGAETLALARDGGAPMQVQVSRLLVDVAVQLRHGSPGRARVVLDRALRLAAPQELRRAFHEAPPAVQRLVSTDPSLVLEHPWLTRSAPPGGRAAVTDRGATAPPTRTDVELGIIENLTAKELEVLGHLQELLTTEEIAEKMFVSVNTVRTHIRSILRKLGVNRRNAAVRKARELGLVAA